MSNLISKISSYFSPKYYIVYKNKQGEIKTYKIGKIDLYKSFGNKDCSRNNMGFKKKGGTIKARDGKFMTRKEMAGASQMPKLNRS